MTPLSASNFGLARCQATLFTPDDELSAARAVRDLLPRWGGVFDGEPIVLPSTDGMPKEIPKVILVSASNEWRCEIASARINVFWSKTTFDSTVPAIARIYEEGTKLLLEYAQLFEPRIARVAAVTSSFAPHESPGLFLARHFCSERWQAAPLNRPENFELHAHKRFRLGGRFTVNSWVRNKAVSIALKDASRPVVLVEGDINTLVEDAASRALSGSEVREFFMLAAQESPSILKLYYPEKSP